MDPTSYSLCQFSFTCVASYIGRPIGRLSERTEEHHPRGLNKGAIKNRQTTIIIHLTESDHLINTREAFRLVYTVRGRLAKSVKSQILFAAEAMGMHPINPAPWIQRQHRCKAGLLNQWPSETHTTIINDRYHLSRHPLKKYPCRHIIPNSHYLLLLLFFDDSILMPVERAVFSQLWTIENRLIRYCVS